MSHELIKVCKKHQVFSEGCEVCQLLFGRGNTSDGRERGAEGRT
jgi:hypothetical protein